MSSRSPSESGASFPSPSLPELSAQHVIVSEDVIPQSLTAALLYSNVDNSNREGYANAHEESLRLSGLNDRVEYARRCLEGVLQRGRLESEQGRLAEKQSGPEEAKAWERVKERQERERKAAAAQPTRFIRSKL